MNIFAAFQENADIAPDMPAIFRHSFRLEQLLSCDEPQICSYTVGNAGRLERNFKELSHRELASFLLRSEIHRGALQYVRDAVRIREDTWSGFIPSRACAIDIFEEFMNQNNVDGSSLLEQLALDDDYAEEAL